MHDAAVTFERVFSALRRVLPIDELSLTAASTLHRLELGGARRLTDLAGLEGVTQPAMTQLVDRLQGAGLLDRVPDPADGRVVQVRITGEGRTLLARRRAVRAERVAELLARLSAGDQALLAAARPALEALANAQRTDARAGPRQPS
jgi:DNA-binding MarR family transcriptional regulator